MAEAPNPQYIEFLNNLNHDINDRILEEKKKTMEEILKLRAEAEDDRWVWLRNGETRKIKVKEVVSILHSDMKQVKSDVNDIKDATEIFTDITKVHKILKKYKVYYPAFAGGIIVVARVIANLFGFKI